MKLLSQSVGTASEFAESVGVAVFTASGQPSWREELLALS